ARAARSIVAPDEDVPSQVDPAHGTVSDCRRLPDHGDLPRWVDPPRFILHRHVRLRPDGDVLPGGARSSSGNARSGTDPEWGGITDPAAGAWFPAQAHQLIALADPAIG
ncbi:MAG TPA: hypothetical protein VIH37_07725, partial [Candidatus Limnocylindrales bacterium]